MPKNNHKDQKVFVQKMKELCPSKHSLPDLISELLGISLDAAYRRLRCETEFTYGELILLCRYFNISIDSLIHSNSGSVSFFFNNIFGNLENIRNHLMFTLQHLQSVSETEDIYMFYAAEEIPIFHSLHSPILIKFKLYYWLRNIQNIPQLQLEKFNSEFFDDEILKLCGDISRYYDLIPSSEIWSSETILTFVKQIEFCLEAGLFKNKEDAMMVVDAHMNMLHELRKDAEAGHKKNRLPVLFRLYRTDIMMGTNCILIERKGIPYSVYIAFNTLNYLHTRQEAFCKEVSGWIKNLIRKSTLLSDSSEKERYKFFNDMFRKMEKLKEKISKTEFY